MTLASVAVTAERWRRVATVNWDQPRGAVTIVQTRKPRLKLALGTSGPEAVQNTGLNRLRQPCFLDITYTLRYISWFLPVRS
jgi:hypothetical protein